VFETPPPPCTALVVTLKEFVSTTIGGAAVGSQQSRNISVNFETSFVQHSAFWALPLLQIVLVGLINLKRMVVT